MLVDNREQRSDSQPGFTDHSVKTSTSPWLFCLGCRRLRSKNLLVLLSQHDTVFLDSTSLASLRSACPLSSPDGRQNQYIPMIVSDQERSDQVIKLLIFLGHLVTSPLGHYIFNVRSNSIKYSLPNIKTL